jgi:hypothetical protein
VDGDPFPAFDADGCCHSLEILGNEPVEQRGIGEIAVMVGLEQVLDDGAACRSIRMVADEFEPRVSGADVRLGELRADRLWLTIPRLRVEPCSFLNLVVVAEGERHELVEAVSTVSGRVSCTSATIAAISILKRRTSSRRGAEHPLHNAPAGPGESIIIEKTSMNGFALSHVRGH